MFYTRPFSLQILAEIIERIDKRPKQSRRGEFARFKAEIGIGKISVFLGSKKLFDELKTLAALFT